MCDSTVVEALEVANPQGGFGPERDAILQPEVDETRARSLLAGVDPRLRVIGSFVFAAAVVALDRPLPLVVAVAIAVGTVLAAGLGARRMGRVLAALDGSMALVVATLPFTTPGRHLFSIMGYGASVEGLTRAAEIALKANAVALMALALLGSSELPEIGHALRRLGVPATLAQLLLMTVRYIEVLGREYRRLRTAMVVRGFRMRFSVHTWRSLGHLFGMLFARSIDRAERIGAAMRCRGFDGEFPVLTEFAYTRRDAAFLGVAAAALALLLAVRLAWA
ncbi:cobalt ECF transporter T component CbiQ [Roseiarcus sp.]|uniref:cobalt ECF transporter T component CbiQ n=1 Tax=Roseiarcus sp. TaxID=1969460 RepID=UPI003F9BCC58